MWVYGSFHCLVGCLSMIVWTPAVLSVLYACVLYFCICTCSAQLSWFHMERRSRNTLIIVIVVIVICYCCYYYCCWWCCCCCCCCCYPHPFLHSVAAMTGWESGVFQMMPWTRQGMMAGGLIIDKMVAVCEALPLDLTWGRAGVDLALILT